MAKDTNILSGMRLVNQTDNASGYNYFGYVRANGECAIMRENEAQTEYLYAISASGYSALWSARTTIGYKIPIYN